MQNYTPKEWYRIFGYLERLNWLYEVDTDDIDVPDDWEINRERRFTLWDAEEQQRELGALL